MCGHLSDMAIEGDSRTRMQTPGYNNINCLKWGKYDDGV
jgi:hypothetical protein